MGSLFVVFLFSRVATLLVAGSLWFDEAFSAHLASLPLGQMLSLLAFEHNPWLPFFITRFALLFGSSDWVLRLPSLIAGVISFWLLYVVAKKLWQSREAAMGACFLFTASTLLLYHQSEARMYSLLIMFVLMCLLSAWQWLQTGKNGWVLLYAISAILLVHTHLTAWLPLLILAALVALEAHHDRKKLGGWAIANVVVFVSGLLWIVPVLWHRLSVPGTTQGWFFAQTGDGYLFNHLTNMLVNGEPRLVLRVLAAAMMTLLMAAAVIKIERPHWWQKVKHLFDPKHWDLTLRLDWSRQTRLLTLWFVLSMLAGFALQITVTKYLIAAIVPAFLLAGRGLSLLNKRLVALAVVAIVLLVAPMHARLLEKRHHWDEAAKQVAALQNMFTNQVTIVHGFAGALPLRRYLPKENIVTPFYPFNDHLSFDEAISRYNWMPIVNDANIATLDALTAGQNIVILVSTTRDSGEADPVKARLWQQGWKLLKQYEYTGYGDPEILVFGR